MTQWQDHEILMSWYKSTLQQMRSHAETPCTQVSSWSIHPFKRYLRKICRSPWSWSRCGWCQYRVWHSFSTLLQNLSDIWKDISFGIFTACNWPCTRDYLLDMSERGALASHPESYHKFWENHPTRPNAQRGQQRIGTQIKCGITVSVSKMATMVCVTFPPS